MGIKAVYESATLAIYVTREDLEKLTHTGAHRAKLYLGKRDLGEAYVHLQLGPAAQEWLIAAHRAYKQAFKAAGAGQSGKETYPGERTRGGATPDTSEGGR